MHDLISYGISGLVVLDRSTNTVIKSPHGEEDQASIDLEISIYERLSAHASHSGFLQYHGPYQSSPSLRGIRLQFAQKFTMENFISSHSSDVTQELRLRWSKQIPNALSHLHALRIIHGDLTCSNIFLTDSLDVKIGDFAGSSMDGSPLNFVIKASHRYPGPLLSIKADIFALGSDLYQIATGSSPYHDIGMGDAGDEDEILQKIEEEITARYVRGEFPEAQSLGEIGKIIARCWHGAYDCADEIATQNRHDQDGVPSKTLDLPTDQPLDNRLRR